MINNSQPPHELKPRSASVPAAIGSISAPSNAAAPACLDPATQSGRPIAQQFEANPRAPAPRQDRSTSMLGSAKGMITRQRPTATCPPDTLAQKSHRHGLRALRPRQDDRAATLTPAQRKRSRAARAFLDLPHPEAARTSESRPSTGNRIAGPLSALSFADHGGPPAPDGDAAAPPLSIGDATAVLSWGDRGSRLRAAGESRARREQIVSSPSPLSAAFQLREGRAAARSSRPHRGRRMPAPPHRGADRQGSEPAHPLRRARAGTNPLRCAWRAPSRAIEILQQLPPAVLHRSLRLRRTPSPFIRPRIRSRPPANLSCPSRHARTSRQHINTTVSVSLRSQPCDSELTGKNPANVNNPQYARASASSTATAVWSRPRWPARARPSGGPGAEQVRDALLDRQVVPRRSGSRPPYEAQQSAYSRAQAGLGEISDCTASASDPSGAWQRRSVAAAPRRLSSTPSRASPPARRTTASARRCPEGRYPPDRFHFTDERLDRVQGDPTPVINSDVGEVNCLLGTIAEINSQIGRLSSTPAAAVDLRDQRQARSGGTCGQAAHRLHRAAQRPAPDHTTSRQRRLPHHACGWFHGRRGPWFSPASAVTGLVLLRWPRVGLTSGFDPWRR